MAEARKYQLAEGREKAMNAVLQHVKNNGEPRDYGFMKNLYILFGKVQGFKSEKIEGYPSSILIEEKDRDSVLKDLQKNGVFDYLKENRGAILAGWKISASKISQEMHSTTGGVYIPNMIQDANNLADKLVPPKPVERPPNRISELIRERLNTPFGTSASEILDKKIRSVLPVKMDATRRRATDPDYPPAPPGELQEFFADPKNHDMLNSPKLLENIQLSNRILTAIDEQNLMSNNRFTSGFSLKGSDEPYQRFADQVRENTARYNAQQTK